VARRDDAGRYLIEGLTPQQIELRMGIGLSSVRQYLCALVGEGILRHSDIAFNIAERHLIEEVMRNGGASDGPRTLRTAQDIQIALSKQGHKIRRELVDLYLLTRDARPDLYSLICEIEVGLHHLVKRTLEIEYGSQWWREGIPESTRKNCQNRKEEDSSPLDDAYFYTTFIELKSIIDNNWRVFSKALSKALAVNKPDTLQRLQRINAIRNKVMHPVKEIIEYEGDYRFARQLLSDLEYKSCDQGSRSERRSLNLS
jgi:hypothetical protein